MGSCEQDSVTGDRIDIWSRLLTETVATEMVGPTGVDADQDNVANLSSGSATGTEKPNQSAKYD